MFRWPNPDNHYLLDDDPEYEEIDEPEDDPDVRVIEKEVS